VGFLRNGKILAEGAPSELMQIYDTNNLENLLLNLCYKEDQKKQRGRTIKRGDRTEIRNEAGN